MLEPISVDRKLAVVAGAWRRWLRRHHLGEDPFQPYLELVSKDTFQQLTDLPDYDPLRAPLRRWFFCLLEQRVNARGLALVAASRRVEQHVVERPEYGRFTLAELLSRALAEPARRQDWLAAFVFRARACAELTRELWQRRAEVARRLEEDGSLALPGIDPAEHATELLRHTQELADQLDTPDLGALVTCALAGDASEGWPARLTLRNLADLFGETPLLQGLPLDPDPLPGLYGGASFLRAFSTLGAAFARAAGPADQPFCVSVDPFRLREHELAALFALLPLTPAFARRGLGLSGERRETQLRALSRAMLIEVRTRALCAKLRTAALSGSSAFVEAFEETSAQAFGFCPDARIAGALWHVHVDAAQRYAGLLTAAAKHEELTEQHDEDWYRNPRAVDQLRAETRLPPATTVSDADLDRGRAALRRLLAPGFD